MDSQTLTGKCQVMITALSSSIQPVTPIITGNEVKEDFSNLAHKLREVPGLIRKYFLLSGDGRTAGALWESKAAAERLYTDDFKNPLSSDMALNHR